jgi:hypothetical protein
MQDGANPNTDDVMNDEPESPRARLFRDAATLQLKLIADGFRDALLIPISLVAALIGLVRGGEDCEREFREVLKLGRRSERWINLFGHQRPLGVGNPAGSMDRILEQVETIVVEQYRKGNSAAEAREAVNKAVEKISSKNKSSTDPQ